MTQGERGESRIELEAAEWVVRLEGHDPDPGEAQAFRDWHGSSELHAAAWRRAERTWQDMTRLPDGALDRHQPVDVIASTDPMPWQARKANTGPASETASPSGPSGRIRRRAIIAMAASMLLALVTLGITGDPITALTADHRTETGEVTSVTLPDGSVADLNTGTAIRVSFGTHRREVELLQGEAHFDVAPLPDGAPFIVRAAETEAQALGTRFTVRRGAEGVTVGVLHHSVAVRAPAQATGRVTAVLQAGQAVTSRGDDGLGPIRPLAPHRTAAWRRGQVIFDNVPLADAVREINRYRTERVVVLGDALSRRRISGVFRIDDLDRAVTAIAAELRADVSRVPAVATLLH